MSCSSAAHEKARIGHAVKAQINLYNNLMRKILLTAALALSSSFMLGQGAKNIKINEVMTINDGSLQDEYGRHLPWVELANISYSTYNIRDMYLTTDKRALDATLSAPDRIKMMSIIPSGDERTSLSAQEHIVFYLNSSPTHGILHLSTKVNEDGETWVALYDGNGIDLIDSVTVPALSADQTYARMEDGSASWGIKAPEAATPGTDNYIETNETKSAKWKRDDPHGIIVTVLAMGIVFSCLALLYIVFRILGIFIEHRRTLKKASRIQPIKAAVKTGELIAETGHKTKVMLTDGMQTKGIDKEIYIAVIAMALKQYQDDVHDVESGIITIRPHVTSWNNELQINEK